MLAFLLPRQLPFTQTNKQKLAKVINFSDFLRATLSYQIFGSKVLLLEINRRKILHFYSE